MIKVTVRPNEPLESALRRFKRQCNYAGIFRLAKKYSFFEKRSDRNRREERERIRNIQRALRKQEERDRPKIRRKSKVRAEQANQDDDVTTVDAMTPTLRPATPVTGPVVVAAPAHVAKVEAPASTPSES